MESVVSLFAILGFVYVPLGRHTGYEHAKAVMATPAAAEAMRDLTAAVLSLRQRALDFVTGTPEPESANPAEIRGPGPIGPTRGPRAVPPKLR